MSITHIPFSADSSDHEGYDVYELSGVMKALHEGAEPFMPIIQKLSPDEQSRVINELTEEALEHGVHTISDAKHLFHEKLMHEGLIEEKK